MLPYRTLLAGYFCLVDYSQPSSDGAASTAAKGPLILNTKKDTAEFLRSAELNAATERLILITAFFNRILLQGAETLKEDLAQHMH
ncbi:hypothetical protein SRHO_G00324220 [Serrasalmus rhombeus]